METTSVFKVTERIKQIDGSTANFSVCGRFSEQVWSVQYLENEFVKPKVGKLFVFENEKDAIEFALQQAGLPLYYPHHGTVRTIDVWEAEATEVEPILNIAGSTTKIQEFWLAFFDHLFERDIRYDPGTDQVDVYLDEAPQGSLVASAVKLTKLIKTL